MYLESNDAPTEYLLKLKLAAALLISFLFLPYFLYSSYHLLIDDLLIITFVIYIHIISLSVEYELHESKNLYFSLIYLKDVVDIKIYVCVFNGIN